MLFLEIRRAACAAAAASALFVITGPVAACEDDYYPAARTGAPQESPTEVPRKSPYAEEIPDVPGDIGVPVGGVSMNDAQIAAILQAANIGEIVQASLALTRAADPAVLAFAQRMLEHHTALIAQQSSLSVALGGMHLESLASLRLSATSAVQVAKLLPLAGPAFDLAYMNAQIMDHKMVLDMMDTQINPTSLSPGVIDLLSSVRPVIAAHLAEAEEILATLGGPR